MNVVHMLAHDLTCCYVMSMVFVADFIVLVLLLIYHFLSFLERPVHTLWETVTRFATSEDVRVLHILDSSADTTKSGILCEKGEYWIGMIVCTKR